MLTTAFVVFVTFLLHRIAHFDISLQLGSTFKILTIMIIALSILFWNIHVWFYGDKDRDRYEELWDDTTIQGLGLAYAILNVIVLLIMEENFTEGDNLFDGTFFFIISIFAIDIISISVIYNSYSHRLKQSIVDSWLFQIQKMRNALFAMLIISCAVQFTIFGLLLLFLVVVIFLSLFNII